MLSTRTPSTTTYRLVQWFVLHLACWAATLWVVWVQAGVVGTHHHSNTSAVKNLLLVCWSVATTFVWCLAAFFIGPLLFQLSGLGSSWQNNSNNNINSSDDQWHNCNNNVIPRLVVWSWLVVQAGLALCFVATSGGLLLHLLWRLATSTDSDHIFNSASSIHASVRLEASVKVVAFVLQLIHITWLQLRHWHHYGDYDELPNLLEEGNAIHNDRKIAATMTKSPLDVPFAC